MKLTEDIEHFILTWGELASRWGFNRTEAQIHALLFVAAKPLTMEEIAQTLSVARSNVSNSLHELISWRIIKATTVRGDRRKHYQAVKDVWEMFRSVVFEQKIRNIDPFIGLVREAKTSLMQNKPRDPAEEHALEQISSMADFFEAANAWYVQLQAMSSATIRQYIKLGGKVLKFL